MIYFYKFKIDNSNTCEEEAMAPYYVNILPSYQDQSMKCVLRKSSTHLK